MLWPREIVFWLNEAIGWAFSAVAGCVNGFLVSAFVIYIWSWYGPTAMPLRLIAWVTACRYLSSDGVLRLVIPFMCSMLWIFPLTFSDLPDHPNEVSLLSSHQRDWISSGAASNKLDLDNSKGTATRRRLSQAYTAQILFLTSSWE